MKDLFDGYCDIARDMLPLYADGCTSEMSSKALRAHITNCSECKKYLKSIKNCNKNNISNSVPDSAPDYSDLLEKVKHRKKIKHSLVWSVIATLAVGNIAFAVSRIVSNDE